ncbi:MAG: acyl carrier protein [Pseudomonadota bacterium]
MSDERRRAIYDDLNGIFADVLDLDDLVLEDATTAEDVEEWDSISHIRLVVSIEQHYGFKFTTAEIEALNSVGNLVDQIQAKTA